MLGVRDKSKVLCLQKTWPSFVSRGRKIDGTGGGGVAGGGGVGVGVGGRVQNIVHNSKTRLGSI